MAPAAILSLLLVSGIPYTFHLDISLFSVATALAAPQYVVAPPGYPDPLPPGSYPGTVPGGNGPFGPVTINGGNGGNGGGSLTVPLISRSPNGNRVFVSTIRVSSSQTQKHIPL